jgi:CheY-like chemotaxis protein
VAGGITILAVDDNLGDLRLLEESFNEQAVDVAFSSARNGVRALSALADAWPSADRRPDLLVLDLNMPGLDGIGVLSAVRSQAAWNALPIFILTTSRLAHEIDECFRLGADEFIVKPTSFDHYLGMVSAIVSFIVDGVPLAPSRALQLAFARAADGSYADRHLQVDALIASARAQRELSRKLLRETRTRLDESHERMRRAGDQPA